MNLSLEMFLFSFIILMVLVYVFILVWAKRCHGYTYTVRSHMELAVYYVYYSRYHDWFVFSRNKTKVDILRKNFQLFVALGESYDP